MKGDAVSDWKDSLNQLGFHIEFDEETQNWFAKRTHDKARIIVSSEQRETLANEIILSYQALLMHAYSELQRANQEIEFLKDFRSL